MGFDPHLRDSFGLKLYEYDEYNIGFMANEIIQKSSIFGIKEYTKIEAENEARESLVTANMICCDSFINDHLVSKLIEYLSVSNETVQLVSIDHGYSLDYLNMDRKIFFPSPKLLQELKLLAAVDSFSPEEYGNLLRKITHLIRHPQRYLYFPNGIKNHNLKQRLFIEALCIKGEYNVEILKEYIGRVEGKYTSAFSVLISPFDDMDIFARVSRIIFSSYD